MPAQPKPSIIDHFYRFTADANWRDGLELYQSGSIQRIETVESLIVSKVLDGAHKMEVRMKIHTGGKLIQWLECSCRQNRMSGQFCPHIVATVFHLHQEKHPIVNQLDPLLLIKPSNRQQKKVSRPAEDTGHAVLEHLRGSIVALQQKSDGGIIADVEIKKGIKSNYQLDIDQAATFSATANVALRLLKDEARQALLIYQQSEEVIVCAKVLVIDSASKLANCCQRMHVYDYHQQCDREITYVSAQKASIGKNYLFLKSVGYLKLQTDHAWAGFANKRFQGDSAAALLEDNFSAFNAAKHLYIDKQLQSEQIVEDQLHTKIVVRDEQDGLFKLSLNYRDDDTDISLTELLTKRKKRKYIKVSRKKWYRLPEVLLDNTWSQDKGSDFMVATALDMHRLHAALGDYDSFVGSTTLLNRLRTKTTFDPMQDTPSLAHSKLNLRSYQQYGFKWLWWLYRNQLHGLLADEMGLGKTHQAMALLTAAQLQLDNFRFLVVCPTSVLTHWQEKVLEFAPGLQPLVYHGSKRFANHGKFADGNLTVITSYGVLLRDSAELRKHHWNIMVLDEAHYVKNNATRIYQVICRLPNAMRVCLSGTPFENDLWELKSIFDFLLPGYLGSDRFFRKHLLRNASQDEQIEQEIVLSRLLHPFKLRRTKEAVLPDLPDKVIDIKTCSMLPAQSRLYKEIFELKAKPLALRISDEQGSTSALHVFAVLNLLKQVCNHPLMLIDGLDIDKHHSGKFELLKELLFEGLQSQQKIVIYSQYVKMIKIIGTYLVREKVKYIEMTGATRNRGKLISQFNNDDTQVFVATLMTGGIGIDLTSASIVIHYDRWWNASKENQATDRVHRIGQQKNVQIFKLVTKDTIEEKIDQIIRSKQDIFTKYLDRDEEMFKNLSREELLQMLS
ncbi:MAG: DEAD/DEAH box helicase [Pseudomonadota bacterium]|nr:DEAD/DEAH box helicase [Pseudomonadota bacterium]